MVEGELQPELDENAIKEQLDATSKCVSIMARQAKLLGLDLQQAVPDDKKDGPKTLQELQLWIINQVNHPSPGGPPMKTIEMQSGVEGLEEE